jgi:hypothetical protein
VRVPQVPWPGLCQPSALALARATSTSKHQSSTVLLDPPPPHHECCTTRAPSRRREANKCILTLGRGRDLQPLRSCPHRGGGGGEGGGQAAPRARVLLPHLCGVRWPHGGWRPLLGHRDAGHRWGSFKFVILGLKGQASHQGLSPQQLRPLQGRAVVTWTARHLHAVWCRECSACVSACVSAFVSEESGWMQGMVASEGGVEEGRCLGSCRGAGAHICARGSGSSEGQRMTERWTSGGCWACVCLCVLGGMQR